MAQKLGPFSGPESAAQKAKVNYAAPPFAPPILGPENGPSFWPAVRGAGSVSSDARRLASARVGRKALTLGLLTVCVVFVNFIVPPVRPVVLGARVPPAQ